MTDQPSIFSHLRDAYQHPTPCPICSQDPDVIRMRAEKQAAAERAETAVPAPESDCPPKRYAPMLERKRYQEAVVVFVDVEAIDRAESGTLAEILVKAALDGRASRIVEDPQAGTLAVTHDYRPGVTIEGRIVETEQLSSAMYHQFLRLDVTRLPWRHLDREEDPDA